MMNRLNTKSLSVEELTDYLSSRMIENVNDDQAAEFLTNENGFILAPDHETCDVINF